MIWYSKCSVLLIVAPVGIFCLISQTFATQGFSSILELLKYFFGVSLVIFIHLCIVYLPFVKYLGKVKIRHFLNGIKQIALFAFSTSSSSATIPITLQNLSKNFSIKKKVSLLLFHLELPLIWTEQQSCREWLQFL